MEERFCIFRERGSIDNHFIKRSHFLKKSLSPWTDEDINVADIAFDLDREHNVSIIDGFKGRVDQRLV